MAEEADPPGNPFTAWLRGLLTPRAAPAVPAPPTAPLPDTAISPQRMQDLEMWQTCPLGPGQRRALMGEAWPVLLRVLEEADATAAGLYPVHLFAAIAPAVARLSLAERAVLAEELAERVRTRPPLTGRPKLDEHVFPALLAHLPPLDARSATALFVVFGRGANQKGYDGGSGLGGFGRLVGRMEKIGGFKNHPPLIDAWAAIRARHPKMHPNAAKAAGLNARVEVLLGITPKEKVAAPRPESPVFVFEGLGAPADAARVLAFAEAYALLCAELMAWLRPRTGPGQPDWRLEAAVAFEERQTGQPVLLPPEGTPHYAEANRARREAVAELIGRTPLAALVPLDPPAWVMEADGIFAAAVARHGATTICWPPSARGLRFRFIVAGDARSQAEIDFSDRVIRVARGRRSAERLFGIRFRNWNADEIQEAAALKAADAGLFDLLWSARATEPSGAWLRKAEALLGGPTAAACREATRRWLDLAAEASAGMPSPAEYREALRYRQFESAVLAFLDVFDGPREAAIMALCTSAKIKPGRSDAWFHHDWQEPPARLSNANDIVLRGAVWFVSLDAAEVPRLLRVALAMLEKVPLLGGVTYRSLIGVNACIGALGRIATPEAVVALGRIQRRVRDERLAKTIAKALATAAAKAGTTIEELEELSVPDVALEPGPDPVRVAELAGGITATLGIASSTSATVTLRRADGSVPKSTPLAVKGDEDSTAALKDLQASAKDIAAILPVQRLRLERSWLTGRSWSGRDFRERYLDHPLLGWLAARLVWTITPASREPFSAMFHDAATPMDAQGRVRTLGDADRVALWHPLAPVEPGAVGAWRSLLLRDGIVQPIKQAFRETYPLTEAERATATYSNRFAAHILRQSQANALARLRGWVCRTRMSADVPNDEPTHIKLPALGLSAEFWTKPDGEGDEMTEGGAHLFLATDRVLFRPMRDEGDWRRDGGRGLRVGVGAVALEDVPDIAFSEVMRDVDLIVGVASIGRDEAWADAGAQAQHPSQWRRGAAMDYWQRFSRAELQESGRVRREVLAALLPKLAIAERCRLEDRHLVVTGALRRYRIHLGSAHVLLDPEDRYVCIVPADRDAAAGIRLPFEGDAVLSLILSKAFLLAADDRITDKGILSQIR
ncbi:DUF4132 domain-containing protein [Roseomonas fluvialis]|uniref:DUF4132 domain-containing protein n=1 Tax=Roseomonas fluvialis TaxID=1750527 RepID=A0ABM7XYC1_9PROT|nr:DUF4132 domain-containing protein [Roseomonas fluvialis]BDG70481.1 hypothetical protein Rmf_04100 [Roseomonas fluvialis]